MYLNYWVSRGWANRGVATHAARKLMQFLEHQWHVGRFFVALSPRNVPSVRVAEKLGFRPIESDAGFPDGAGSTPDELLYERQVEGAMADLDTSMLEEADRSLYKVDHAEYDISCKPETGRSEYKLTVKLTKKVDSAFYWYTRFEKGSKAKYLGVNITSPKIPTTHQLSMGDDGSLREIAIELPDTVKVGESVTLWLHYMRNVERVEVVDAGFLGAKKVLLGFFALWPVSASALSSGFPSHRAK